MSPFTQLLVIALVCISAFMSASEIALFSLSRFQLRSMKERVRSGHRKIKRLLADPSGLLLTILVVNELVNVWLSALIAEAVSQSGWRAVLPGALLGKVPEWVLDSLLGTLLTAPLLLFFCEATPKVIAARANRLFASLAARPLTAIYDILKPVRGLLKKVLAVVARWSGAAGGGTSVSATDSSGEIILKEADFMLMVEEGHKEGEIQRSELDLIRNVFELDNTTVGDVYTPLAQTRTLLVNATLKAAFSSIRGLSYSRVPILSLDRRQVVGILYTKDLLRIRLDPSLMTLTVDAIMRKPLFVHPAMRLNTVFRRFKQAKTHMGVVQDTSGRSVGIVTMNDIFTALFEDLFPDADGDEELQESPT